MSWQKLTPSAKKKITSDWNAEFPDFGIYKPMHLLRRSGPLLVGVLLERGSGNDNYKPIFHVHNLVRACPELNLSLPRDVPNEYVHVEWHQSKYPKMAKQLRELAYLPLSGELALADVVKGFHAYLREPFSSYEPDVFRDLALIFGWCGNQAEAATVLCEAEDTMKRWPAAVLKQFGGLEQWLSAARASVENHDALRATVIEQITTHGVENIPATELR